MLRTLYCIVLLSVGGAFRPQMAYCCKAAAGST